MSSSEEVVISIYICKFLKILRLKGNYSPNTIRSYGSDLLQVFQIKGKGRLELNESSHDLSYRIHWSPSSSPTKMSLQDWRELALKQTQSWRSLSIKSKKRKWSSLKAFLHWLEIDEGLLIKITYPSLKKAPEKLPHFLSVDECLLLAKHLLNPQKKSSAFNQQRLLFFLMYGAGLRLSEACKLSWEDIHLSSKKLLLEGKGRKERIVVLPQLVCSILKEYGNSNTHYIWGSHPIPQRTAYERIRKLGSEAGLFKSLNPHALRHSYASQLLTSGSDLRVLQQLLGHSSLSATELYTHLDIDHLARSMEHYHPLGSRK